MKKIFGKAIAVFTVGISFLNLAMAQEKKVAKTSPGLFVEIARMDSTVFAAFNSKDILKFQSLFSKDLEWFQDNGGLLNYKTVFENFATMFRQTPDLKRELVMGTLEIHPIKDYGAIEIGTHRFRHFENGKEESGTFKFLMIWKKKDGLWKITRVVSYDH
jgi:ketosteroid isomerase-like protein